MNNFFENHSRKWRVAFFIFWVLFYSGADQVLSNMILENVKPAAMTSHYLMMFFCFGLLLVFLIPFALFLKYSCQKMRVSFKLALFAFISGLFIPGYITGYLNGALADLIESFTSKAFVSMWGAAITSPLIEEAFKAGTVLFLLMLLGYKQRRHYLIAGMAGGMGFQIAEDFNDIENVLNSTHSLQVFSQTLTRITVSLVSHWTYTALTMTALWFILYGHKKKKGILLYLFVMAAHFLWDTPLTNFGSLPVALLSAPVFIVFLYDYINTLPQKASAH